MILCFDSVEPFKACNARKTSLLIVESFNWFVGQRSRMPFGLTQAALCHIDDVPEVSLL